MARLARAVAPGMPHHVTQRGNRCQEVFFGAADYAAYRGLMAEGCRKAGVRIWAYCLMPNHVHLILVPPEPDSLRAALGETHRRYTRMINAREGWRGYLWQGRFASFPVDEPSLLACARYIELNPVRAGLTRSPQAWCWSSAAAHLAKRDDELVETAPLAALVPDWRGFLAGDLSERERESIRAHERTGRPLGSDRFVAGLERKLGRTLAKQKPGRKPAEE